MFEKVLIANRGEIALRIHRACREMGISTVAIHSTADADAMHVRLADESVCVGPPSAGQSYLNIPAIISAASIAGADAIHPGYGFLSENQRFAEIVEAHDIAFIGPSPSHIAMMGDKVEAKRTMIRHGVPVVPGSDGPVASPEEAVAAAEITGYPLLIKAASGGGGRGIKRADNQAELLHLLPITRSEAKANFGNDEVYLERFLVYPRHIEMQILADAHGNVVHLGERDCSLQRKSQKILEEAPSPALNQTERDHLGKVVCDAIRAIGYRNAGTLEFLYEDGQFYFMEMNTRLQVEHPVTEMITGIDLVREQIRIASGAALGYGQDDIELRGHAIECRLNAENPDTFTPSPGLVTEFHAAGGLDVRVDSALYAGYSVPPHYDSLVAKLIARGRNRNECILRLRRALEECVIQGIETTIPLHLRLTAEPEFIDGQYDIHWLERWLGLKT